MLAISYQYLFPILFFTGFLAGTVDAIAGGGGLISVPVLLSLGVPPHIALGTNKLQTSCGTFMAAHKYYHQGLIDKQKLRIGLIFTFIGALVGAITIQLLSADIIEKIIPILLLLILIYTVLTPHFGNHEQIPKISERLFFIIFGFLLGFYDGFLGPGVGSLWVFALMFFVGFNLIKATAYTKVFNLNTNLVGLVCFAVTNNIDYKIGLCMAAGQIFGGRLGAHLAIKKGTALIRPIFILVFTVTVVALFYRNYESTFVAYDMPLYGKIGLVMSMALSIVFVYFFKIKIRRS